MGMYAFRRWWIQEMSYYGILAGLSKRSHYPLTTRVTEHFCQVGARAISFLPQAVGWEQAQIQPQWGVQQQQLPAG